MKKKILLVEDDEQLRKHISGLLEKFSDVYSCASFKSAVAAMEQANTIDALVTDFNLKSQDGKDGLDVTLAFRTANSSAPVILATGSPPETEPRIGELLALPLTYYIEKPTQVSTIPNVIRSLLNIEK